MPGRSTGCQAGPLDCTSVMPGSRRDRLSQLLHEQHSGRPAKDRGSGMREESGSHVGSAPAVSATRVPPDQRASCLGRGKGASRPFGIGLRSTLPSTSGSRIGAGCGKRRGVGTADVCYGVIHCGRKLTQGDRLPDGDPPERRRQSGAIADI
jgi:hypothetical protein